MESFNMQAKSIYYKGRRAVWGQTIDICLAWKKEKKLPLCFTASPYPRPFLTDAQFKGVIDTCCTGTEQDYLAMREHRNELSTIENEETAAKQSGIKTNLAGLKEAICINDQDVMNDFGFTSELLRAIIKQKSGTCWECQPSKCTPALDAKDREFGGGCSNNDLVQPMICDGDEVTPKNFWWFLRYISDKEDKAYALMACAEGAAFGRGATALSGLAIGVEAQERALKKYEKPFKTLAFVAMHHCGVAAALDANNYYEAGAECNANAFPMNMDDDRKC
jgi:hypothetical protein